MEAAYAPLAYTATMSSLADLRKSYERAELDESASDGNPTAQFSRWLDEAIKAEVPEPNAMTLATVGSNLRPSTRVVLIKGFNENSVVWYTNYDSHKGHELAGNPYAALQFHWVELERVVRIEGLVEKVSPEESDAYFHSRPVSSQLGAWASDQSTAITDRSILEQKLHQLETEYQDRQIPKPPHWGGVRVVPQEIEFWQGRPSRLHDRLRYQLVEGKWQIVRLAP